VSDLGNFLCRSIRYARWSLGFVNPPLEISGTGNKCIIRALNDRGNVLLPAIIGEMNNLLNDNILKDVQVSDGQIDVTVAPIGEIGSFSEEDRSRQVSHKNICNNWPYFVNIIAC
jgi:anthranilate synthase